MPTREHWAAFNFHPTHGPEFEQIDSQDGDVYEVVIKAKRGHPLGSACFHGLSWFERMEDERSIQEEGRGAYGISRDEPMTLLT